MKGRKEGKGRSRALEVLLLAAVLLLVSTNTFISYQSFRNAEQTLKELQRMQSTQVVQQVVQLSNNSHAYAIVERSIPIVAVSTYGKGVVGELKVKLIPGNNNVLIRTNPFVEADLQYSANTAVTVAKLMSNYSYDRDFILSYNAGEANLLGGGSAGAATAIAVLAALQGKELRNDSVITGTINPDGSIGRIGGVLEKAKAVAEAGYKHFLIPKGQARITYYEKVTSREPTVFGFDILNTRYVPKTIDLQEVARKEWGLDVVEVSSIEEALPYFLE